MSSQVSTHMNMVGCQSTNTLWASQTQWKAKFGRIVDKCMIGMTYSKKRDLCWSVSRSSSTKPRCTMTTLGHIVLWQLTRKSQNKSRKFCYMHYNIGTYFPIIYISSTPTNANDKKIKMKLSFYRNGIHILPSCWEEIISKDGNYIAK